MNLKEKNVKLKKWSKSDIYLVIITYVINVILFALLFVGICAVNAYADNKNFFDTFSGGETIVDFTLIISLVFAVTALYFWFEDRNFLRSAANSEMLFLIWGLGVALCFLSGKFINPYVRPFAFVAVLTLFLSDTKLAIFSNFIFTVIMFVFDSFSEMVSGFSVFSLVFFVATGQISGIVAVYFTKNLYSRLKLLLMSLLISLPSVICVVLPMVDFGGNAPILNVFASVFSGPFAVALFIIFLPFFEGVFKKITCFKLAELTDHKSKLIRKLITQAPGTFNHSIIVSNIAEACATAIGEDALLARTCAYYHDIGKLRRPEFFAENQADGEDLHSDLTPELSANIIKSHTIDGCGLAQKNNLPKEIADVCIQHHGTLPILYFYGKAKKFTDGEVPIANFCYAGPKPQTKIAVIIMIADGAEAAVRSLKERTREAVTVAVKKIVSERMQLGQFDECEITLHELNIIINTVVNSLSGVYHGRIKYPKVSLEGVDIENKEENSEKTVKKQ